MNNKSLLILLVLFFAGLKGMQRNDLDHSQEQEIAEQKAESTEQPASLVDTVAKFLAHKLIADIKVEVEGEKEVSYEEYLAAYPLNEDVKQLIMKTLVKNKSKLLWKLLPYNVTHQNLGIEFMDVLSLSKNHLLILCNELPESPPYNYNSKIKIWDMANKEWLDIKINLPEVTVYDWSLSKDSKTLFLWCSGYSVIVFDLENNKEISRITLGSDVIKSVCLLNNEHLICCGTVNGKVKIFDKDSAKKVFSFKVSDHSINAIDCLDNVIVTVDSDHISYYKLDNKEQPKGIVATITHQLLDGQNVRNLRLGLNGEALIVNFLHQGHETVELLKLPMLERLKLFKFCPSYVGFKRSQDGEMFFASEGSFNFYGTPIWEEFDRLTLLDAETGAMIRKFDFSEDETRFSDSKSYIKWRGFAISPDNSFIILYDKQGHIAKISLDLEEGLESVLAKIKTNIIKVKAKSQQSKCLVS